MRFMIIVKASPRSEAGQMPSEALKSEMTSYHAQLKRAGVLLDASTLQPSSAGWRIRHGDGRRSVIEGPFAPPDALVAGYTLIEVRDRNEAMEWARRFPNPHPDEPQCEIEVRALTEHKPGNTP